MNIFSRKSLALFALTGGLFFANSFGMQGQNPRHFTKLTWGTIISQGGDWEKLDILAWDKIKNNSWEENRPIAEALFNQLLKIYRGKCKNREAYLSPEILEDIALVLCSTLCRAFGKSLILHPKLQNKFMQEIKNVRDDLETAKIPLPDAKLLGFS